MQIEDFDNIVIPWSREGKSWDGLPMARVGLRAAFYLGNCYSKEARGPLMAVVDEYLRMADGRIQASQRGGDRRRMAAGPGKPVDVERLRERVANFQTDWAIEASGEEDINVASHWSLVTVADDIGYLLVHFPLAAFKIGAPETFRGLFQRWCGLLNVEHAYAGLGFVLPVGGRSMSGAIGEMGPLANRFVGLDLDYPNTIARRCRDGIRTVNWLTAIDENRLDRVGGAQRVLKIAGPEVTSMPYSRGTIFVAGQAPEVGDNEAGKFPQAYAQLGHAVAPLRSAIPETWFDAPPGYEAPPGFTSKLGGSDAEPEQLPALYYLKAYLGRFDGSPGS
jgi:hypothetical protein